MVVIVRRKSTRWRTQGGEEGRTSSWRNPEGESAASENPVKPALRTTTEAHDVNATGSLRSLSEVVVADRGSDELGLSLALLSPPEHNRQPPRAWKGKGDMDV